MAQRIMVETGDKPAPKSLLAVKIRQAQKSPKPPVRGRLTSQASPIRRQARRVLWCVACTHTRSMAPSLSAVALERNQCCDKRKHGQCGVRAAPGRLPRLSQVVKNRQCQGLHAENIAGANIVQRLRRASETPTASAGRASGRPMPRIRLHSPAPRPRGASVEIARVETSPPCGD